MAEGLMVLDPAGNVMYSNETAKPLLGLATDEVHGKHIGEILGRVASEFEPSNGMKALLDLAQSPGDSPSTVALTLERPQRRHLEVTSFHIPARDDRTMMGLLARDVTQEKELQDRRDSFVSIASHEFRTPMTTIMGFSELLLNNTDVPDSTRNDWLERIYQNSKVLASIVDNMLSVTRIQSGRLVVNIESVRLSKVVDDVLASIEPDTHEAHSFEASVPQDIPDVMVDREKLTQVLINLVTNAVKYSPQGGRVTVSARTEAERGRVVVAVADEGIGVAPEDQERLFESFHRISRPETEGIRGTGLSVVKGLVELMGGDVWVESELGKGSSFFFTVSTKGSDVQQARDKGKSPAT
jgi:PAS domain S-box-containing protein